MLTICLLFVSALAAETQKVSATIFTPPPERGIETQTTGDSLEVVLGKVPLNTILFAFSVKACVFTNGTFIVPEGVKTSEVVKESPSVAVVMPVEWTGGDYVFLMYTPDGSFSGWRQIRVHKKKSSGLPPGDASGEVKDGKEITVHWNGKNEKGALVVLVSLKTAVLRNGTFILPEKVVCVRVSPPYTVVTLADVPAGDYLLFGHSIGKGACFPPKWFKVEEKK